MKNASRHSRRRRPEHFLPFKLHPEQQTLIPLRVERRRRVQQNPVVPYHKVASLPPVRVHLLVTGQTVADDRGGELVNKSLRVILRDGLARVDVHHLRRVFGVYVQRLRLCDWVCPDDRPGLRGFRLDLRRRHLRARRVPGLEQPHELFPRVHRREASHLTLGLRVQGLERGGAAGEAGLATRGWERVLELRRVQRDGHLWHGQEAPVGVPLFQGVCRRFVLADDLALHDVHAKLGILPRAVVTE